MKIEGYVICCPYNTWGDKTLSGWHPLEYTFGKTAHEAWIRFLSIRPDDERWDRFQTSWINRGYCPKKTTMEIEL